MERRLRHDLRRTKALLADAHTVLHRQADFGASRATIKQLKHQVADDISENWWDNAPTTVGHINDAKYGKTYFYIVSCTTVLIIML